MIRDTKGDTRRDILLVWTEPSIALSLTKNPMKEGVVPVVVHREGGKEGCGSEKARKRDECIDLVFSRITGSDRGL
jgi:hypothetical protein